MSTRIYLPEFSEILPPKQAQHVRVLRLNINDEIELFDGQGNVAQAKIKTIDKKNIGIEIVSQNNVQTPKTFPIHLGMSIIREMEWAIQKAVELGVTEITPIVADRSQGRFKPEQAAKKMQHWQEIIIAACEQSGLNFLPKLNNITPHPCPLPQGARGLILDPYATKELRDIPPSASATLLIGPEGGFTEAEIKSAKAAGYQTLRMHDNILRAETAAIAAIALSQFHFVL